MKNNFLTIPVAPTYEINSDLIVRNKETGRFLKPYVNSYGTAYYRLTAKKTVHRSAKNLRFQAEAAVNPSVFFPVPSLGGKYEINRRGTLRNSKTKRILSLQKHLCYHVYRDGKTKPSGVSKSSLIAEVFGVRKKKSSLPINVVLAKGDRQIYFDSIRQATFFLSPKVFYSVNFIRKHFTRRNTFIFGWHVYYLNS